MPILMLKMPIYCYCASIFFHEHDFALAMVPFLLETAIRHATMFLFLLCNASLTAILLPFLLHKFNLASITLHLLATYKKCGWPCASLRAI